jgi:hypothetical protein
MREMSATSCNEGRKEGRIRGPKDRRKESRKDMKERRGMKEGM